MKRIVLRKDSYYDSVFLMLISADIKRLDGVSEAVVAMGTEMNVTLLTDMGLGGQAIAEATANDMIIAIDALSEDVLAAAEAAVDERLKQKAADAGADTWRPGSSAAAYEAVPEANVVLISLPGAFAAREARKALLADRHVMMFSDNVSLEEEIHLKHLARDRGLLMMGPDCGTAIINGKPLCFANVVPHGPIGVVSASGTGLQEVTSLIARAGSGISQGIGTGGRDLKSKEVGGTTALMAIHALGQDPATRVIAVISKPPAPELAQKLVDALQEAGKPAVMHLIGMKPGSRVNKNITYAENLEDVARIAVELASGSGAASSGGAVGGADTGPAAGDSNGANVSGGVAAATDLQAEFLARAKAEASKMAPAQQYLRGYFTGGTLTDEAAFLLNEQLGGIYSFDPADPAFKLADPQVSQAHTIVDLGEDVFTVGRPHPMIDPSIRTERMNREVADETIAVVLLDCVIGYGSHADPAGALLPSIERMRQAAQDRGGYLPVVASVTGTDGDPQGLNAQRRTLESAGVIVMPSNYRAAGMAGAIMAQVGAQS